MAIKISIHKKYENKWMFFIVIFILLSLLIILITIAGSVNGKIFFDKINFNDEHSNVHSISYNLFGYCIDNNCTYNLIYDFDTGK